MSSSTAARPCCSLLSVSASARFTMPTCRLYTRRQSRRMPGRRIRSAKTSSPAPSSRQVSSYNCMHSYATSACGLELLRLSPCSKLQTGVYTCVLILPCMCMNPHTTIYVYEDTYGSMVTHVAFFPCYKLHAETAGPRSLHMRYVCHATLYFGMCVSSY